MKAGFYLVDQFNCKKNLLSVVLHVSGSRVDRGYV